MKKPWLIAIPLLTLATGGCTTPITIDLNNFCPGNLVQNGDFTAGVVVVGNGSMPPSQVAGWSSAFGSSPQVSSGPACGNNGFITMWGNQIAGEAIQQTLATPIVANKTYRLFACVRWRDTGAPLPPYVRFKVRASNGSLPNYTSAAATIGTIGLTPGTPPPTPPGITDPNWKFMVLQDWVAPGSFDTITINPENALAVSDPTQISWGQIDNVCLREVVKTACTLDPGLFVAGNTAGRRSTQAQTFVPTQSGPLTKITHSLEKLTLSVTNYDLLVTTTNAGVPAWTGGSYNVPSVLFKATGLTVFSTNSLVNAVVQIPSGQEPQLTAGTLYALILIPGSPSNGLLEWAGNTNPASYPSGTAYELTGTTWTVPASGPKDFGFILDGICSS